MNLYLISHEENTCSFSQTYDAAVVVAENEEQARMIHPQYGINWRGIEESPDYASWVDCENVKVKLIGITEQVTIGVILASASSFGEYVD